MVTQTPPQAEGSDASFKTVIKQSEQRIIIDITTAIKQSEQRTIADITGALKQSEQRIMIAIEDAKVSTIRWIVGSTVAISFVMIGCISGAVIWVAP